ncbi:alpha/beta fold hydrolase [Paenibacillaceae bacterium WGS1546]|uniref:alpha/beta fold hydrolase n=1 Tax=Cohnella sp. WGS1546 TaxID=3366810 RepID=UPI00372D7446
MKKVSLFALALVLLLAAMPLTASASDIKLRIDQEAVTFPDAKPYKNGNHYMIPLRQTAQALGLKVEFDQASGKVAVSGPNASWTVAPGSDQATAADGTTVALRAQTVAKHNRTYVPLSFFEQALRLSTAYHEDSREIIIFAAKDHDAVVKAIVELLVQGEFEQLAEVYFDDSIKAALPAEALQAGWLQTAAAAGEFAGLKSIGLNPDVAEHREMSARLGFSNFDVVLTVNLNDANRIIGLWLSPFAEEAPLPDTLIEEEIVVGEGTSYPLPGTLTLPKNASGPLKAVVLVHGSGPHDRDETVGPVKPFRDIAWGLAEQGIAVLRYDKRTFVHGKSFTPDILASFTVKEETVDDAVAAAKLLKADKRIDAAEVYVIGHSLGGMLAPRIDADGGDFAGLAILAGSPRTLWEIIADQFAAVIAAMDDADPAKQAREALVAAELEKAKNIGKLTDEEAKAQTVFGLPAYYFKEMDERGAAELSAKLTKPVLVLQGQSDVQVYADKDYVLWQEVLKNNKKASFKLYPELNHFFTRDSDAGDNKLDPQVVQDLANWILAG